ncbi:MAG: hypothetical protein JWP58_1257 [Hymenobacter sp.]|nr:hypothetical protein [Hymenobacter sp.]
MLLFRQLNFFLLCFALVGAVVAPPAGQNDRPRGVRLTYSTQAHGRTAKQRYAVHVPRGFQLTRVLGSHETELRLTYPDSAVFYLTDDDAGSELNAVNFAASGRTYPQLLLQDTLSARGTQANHRKWRQVKTLGVVIGYVNVPAAREQEFEEALATLQRRN